MTKLKQQILIEIYSAPKVEPLMTGEVKMLNEAEIASVNEALEAAKKAFDVAQIHLRAVNVVFNEAARRFRK